ncbi:AI-2E family transporter [Bradyrhizobium sp. TZ2]
MVFVFLALLDIGDLRDRFLRLLGGNFHRSTDAIREAGARISRYLLMQLLVNVSYGVPLAAGLWIIGVPGALLWGAVGAVMRFVPYVGPLIAAIFPVSIAFAVDSGWSMLLWTVALIVILELISNNTVEPLLYGSSTGLSAISLIAAAILWTALWGPVGLILSTPSRFVY